MENINNISSVGNRHEVQSSTNVEKKLKPKQSEFLKKFEKIKSDDVRIKLESIYEDIIKKSDSFKDTLTIKGVLEYKKLVKNFMEIAVSNSHVFSQQNSLDRRGRHRVYSTIKQIDRELDSITRESITNHIDHARVLSNIDAIRGLLVDIMT